MQRARNRSDGPAGGLDDVSVSRRSSLSLPRTQYRSPETGETRSTATNAVYAPPSDPRDPNVSTPRGLRALVGAFLLVAVVPAALFVASRPLVGVVGLAALLVLFTGARRAAASLGRLGRDRPLQFDLPGGVRLRVVRHPPELPAEEVHSEA